MFNYDRNVEHWLKTYFLSPGIQQKDRLVLCTIVKVVQAKNSFQGTIHFAFTVLPV